MSNSQNEEQPSIGSLLQKYKETNLTPYLYSAMYGILDLKRKGTIDEEQKVQLMEKPRKLAKAHEFKNKIRMTGIGSWQFARGKPYSFTAYLKPKRFTHERSPHNFKCTEIRFNANSVEEAVEYANKWYGINGTS